MSFMAVSKTGDIMGMIFNSVIRRNENVETWHNEMNTGNSKLDKIVIFMNKLNRGANVFDRYPNIDLTLKMRYITVKDAHRGQGVCKALINKTRLGWKRCYEVGLNLNGSKFNFFLK